MGASIPTYQPEPALHSGEELARALQTPDLPVITYHTDDGRAWLFIDINGGLSVSLPCTASGVIARIANSVLREFRERP